MAKPKILLDDFSEMLHFDSEVETMPIDTAIPMKEGILEMEFDHMEPFPNHKFKLYQGKQFDDMTDSIRLYGILQPLLLWHTEDDHYIILSGHNRMGCGKAAGLNKGPVIIKKNLTLEEAILIVIETNLRQRSFSDMSQSERAYCLFEHYKAMKSQGKRNDIILEIERLMNANDSKVSVTSAEISRSSGSRSKLAEQYSLTENMLAKYIRIGEYLNISLMKKFDDNEFTISVANTLSFVLDKEKQQRIADFLSSENYRLDGTKADLLRNYYEHNKLTDITIMQILAGEKTKKSKSNKPQPVKVKPAVITKYFSAEQSQKEIEETIDKALAMYFKNSLEEVMD